MATIVLDGKQSKSFTGYDVCIVGSGAVGCSLSYELKNAGLRVAVLESTAENHALQKESHREWWNPRFDDPKTASLNTGKLTPGSWLANIEGRNRFNFFKGTRSRVLGGSTNCWGGFIRPLDEYDFHLWPIKKPELDPFYKEALKFVKLDGYDIYDDPNAWSDLTTAPVKSLPDTKFMKTVVIQQNQDTFVIDFQENKLFKDLFDGENIDLIRNATLIDLDIYPSPGYVRSAKIGTLIDAETPGQNCTIEANYFVLAMGGIETAHFLLNYIERHQNDPNLKNIFPENVVGKYFMNHPKWGNLETSSTDDHGHVSFTFRDVSYYFDPKAKMAKDDPVRHLYVEPVQLKSNPYRHIYGYLTPTGISNDTSKFVNGNFRYGIHVDQIKDNTWKITGEINIEQRPNFESQIRLDPNSENPWGLKKVEADLQFSNDDKLTFENAQQLLIDSFQTMGPVEDIVRMSWNDIANPSYVPYTGHHMGTVMMNLDGYMGDPLKMRLVNENLRVNSLINAFICSTGVFPQVGWGNASHTVIALSIRLAEYLKKTIKETQKNGLPEGSV